MRISDQLLDTLKSLAAENFTMDGDENLTHDENEWMCAMAAGLYSALNELQQWRAHFPGVTFEHQSWHNGEPVREQ